MAVDIFRKLDNQKGLFGIEKLTLIYTVLTSVCILLLFRQMDHPVRMLVERACIVAGTCLLMYLTRVKPCKFMVLVRIVFHLALLSYWYPDTYEFNRLLPNLDHLFASFEQWIFGGQPSIWFSRKMPHFWVSEFLNFGYFFFYPMIITVEMWIFLHCYKDFKKSAFILEASFFIYYIIYIFLPVAGPQFYFPVIGFDNVSQGIFPAIGNYFQSHCELMSGSGNNGGLFYQLVEISQRVGERPTAAFPSSHVGIATILMILAGRRSRRLMLFLLPVYVLLCCATVYIQAHYVIDSIAGFISAFCIYAFTEWLYGRCVGSER